MSTVVTVTDSNFNRGRYPFYEGSPGQIYDQLYVLIQPRAIMDVSTCSDLMTVFTAHLYIADINVQGICTHI